MDWVSGAAVMFRFASIAEVGFFDPDFFLYYEEADLMRRMSVAGWQGWHVAEARVIHAEGAATQVRSHDERRRRPDYWYDSRRMYFEKNHGRLYALATAGFVAASGLVHFGIRGDPASAAGAAAGLSIRLPAAGDLAAADRPESRCECLTPRSGRWRSGGTRGSVSSAALRR